MGCFANAAAPVRLNFALLRASFRPLRNGFDGALRALFVGMALGDVKAVKRRLELSPFAAGRSRVSSKLRAQGHDSESERKELSCRARRLHRRGAVLGRTSQPTPTRPLEFYGGLFGWEFEDAMPAGSQGRYRSPVSAAARSRRCLRRPGCACAGGLEHLHLGRGRR